MQIAQTQEARSLDSPLTRDDVLRLIPQYGIKPFFRRHHIMREVIIGIIGLRGDGKSATTASTSLVDHMLEGRTVWSNMEIKCDIEISDTQAQEFGLSHGGAVHYCSQPLEKEALLRLDDRYRGGCLAIEEINVQYSNVRRFMTNTNVDFNIVIQQLRKFQTSLIYNVIDEMFIDPQLRTLTDVFIKCEETAFAVEGLLNKKQPGIDFKWIIYPMSGYLVGRERSYYVTKKPLTPVYFHFFPLRGIYDDKQFQRKGVYSVSTRDGKAVNVSMDMQSDKEVLEQADKWGWLEEKVLQLKMANIDYLEDVQLWQFLEAGPRGLNTKNLAKELMKYGVAMHHQNGRNRWVYKIDTYDIDNMSPHERTIALQRV